jgi:catechol 2,3-dioxygenase-like lactoylglutathione lyase family enzyme
MTWFPRRAGLACHDLAAGAHFFGTLLGLGPATQLDATTLDFGSGLRLGRAPRVLGRQGAALLGGVGARHLAVDVADLGAVAANLRRAGLPCIAADAGEFGGEAVFTLEPGGNLIAFCQAGPGAAPGDGAGWVLHHVNLEVPDVRATAAFFLEMAGIPEGPWKAPAARGDFSIDPRELAPLPSGDQNEGIHVIRADPGFAFRNRFIHNPSVGGHPAFCVAEVAAVKARLTAAGIPVTDAGTYAMAGMHQLYVMDPSGNMIEVNQRLG